MSRYAYVTLVVRKYLQNDAHVAEPVIGPGGEIINLDEYNRRLRHELLNRDSTKSVKQRLKPLTSTFRDSTYEHAYANTRDVTSCISLLGLPITLVACLVVYLLVGPM